jgi:hypothetical protein
MSSMAPAANHAAAVSDPTIGGDAGLVPALQDGLQRLNACAAEVFLALGGALQSVAVEAREVAGLSKAAVGLGTAGESDQSMHKLQLVLTDAVQVQALGQVSREKLHEVFSHLKQSRAPLDRLMNLPSVLNIVGMLYRIEASRLESASINVSSLTGDMDGMGRQIGKRVATVGAEAARLSRLIKEGTEQLDRVEEQERTQAADLIRQTGAVIGSFRARQEAAGQTAVKIDKEYGDMRQASDRIVMSLQSEDMARQRIEHVQEAISRIATGVEAGGLHSGDADVLLLQRSQLSSTRGLLSDSIASVRDGLRSLGPRLDALTADTSAWASHTDQEGHSFSAEVKSKLGALGSIFGAYLNSAQKVVTTVDSVLPGLVEMTNAVNEVEEIHASIRVLALNAGIKTARSGKLGAAIGALAVELHEIARQSDGDTRAVLESLHAMQGPLKEMEERKITSLSSNMMQWSGQQMTQEMNCLIDPVLADSLKLSKMLAVLFEKTAKLRTDLKSAVAVAERAGVVIQMFDSVLEELDRNLGRMGYSPDAVLSHDGKTARLSALYSMESERLVHEQLLGVGKPSPDAAGATPTAADELGSNVELF